MAPAGDSAASRLLDIVTLPFRAAASALVFVAYAVEHALHRPSPKMNAASRRTRRLSVMSENWARGLWPASQRVPNPIIQSVLWFKPEDTPTPEEVAAAFYHGTVVHHSRMRSLLVEHTQDLPEGVMWKLLKAVGLAGDKKIQRMAFEEQPQYLLPEDVPEALRDDQDVGTVPPPPAKLSGPRGPAYLLAHHIKAVDVSSEAEIWDRVGGVMSSDPFDPELALWSIRIYRGEGGHRNAVVFGISHIVGDGISLMKLATSFFAEAGTGKQLKFTPPPRWNPTFKSWAERIGFFLADAWYMVRAFTRVAGFLFGADTKTEIKCGYYPDYKYVPTRRCVQFRPIPFDVLNKVRELAQGKLGSTRKPTIHDVLHSLFAGAIAAYLEERKDEGFRKAGKGALVRIWTPFMFPHPDFSQDPSDDLHNMWSMSSTALPVTEPDPLRRLANSQRVNSNLLRSGHDARAVMMTQRWFSTLFGWEIQGIINLRATTAHTLTWSNVPGFSRTPIAVYAPNGGPLRTVDDAVFVLSAPTPYVTSHSYAGRLNTVMIADPGLVKDMERFGELFYEGFRELAGCVGVEVE